jgi:predicted GNAT family N-acyltransferase
MANSLGLKTAPFYLPRMPHAFIVRAANWKLDESGIAAIRRAVFIEEQGVPEALEWEAEDVQCHWFVGVASDQSMIGIVRLTGAGRIGRMAVLPAWRRRGVGRALLATVLTKAQELSFAQVHLSAQTHAIGFYARHGFIAQGPEYPDAGIPHRSMSLELRISKVVG